MQNSREKISAIKLSSFELGKKFDNRKLGKLPRPLFHYYAM